MAEETTISGNTADCPCGSGNPFTDCCHPVVLGERSADSPEALMRSRYCAYATGEVDHLKTSLHPSKRGSFNRKQTQQWSEAAHWLGLDIVESEVEESGDKGRVHFKAKYEVQGQELEHEEEATFVKEDGAWYFLTGRNCAQETVRREGAKVGRNDPCPCGSGKKSKKCCS